MTDKPKRYAERITVSLDEDTYQGVAQIAERYRVSKSWVIRQAVSETVLSWTHGKQVPLPFSAKNTSQPKDK